MTDVVGLPDGVRVELSRATVRPGAAAEADRWMALLRERHAECVATLDRERMAVEVVFRSREDDGTEHLWWFALRGEEGVGLSDQPLLHRRRARGTGAPC